MAASNLTKSQEDNITEFVSFTGAETNVAKQFLEACSWNKGVAMDRYFNNSDPSQFDTNKFANNNRNGNMNNNNGNIGSGGSSSGVDADAALARALAESGNNNNNNNNNGNGNLPAQGANPIANMFAGMFGMTPAALQQMHGAQAQGYNNRLYEQNNVQYDPQSGVRAADAAYSEQLLPSQSQRVTSFEERRKQHRDNLKDFSNEWQQGSARGGKKSAKSDQLAKIFAEPEYRFVGNFEEAKIAGQKKNAWILVNIQSTSNFVSHCLNRDVWNDKDFSDIVKSCFIFYQYTGEQSHGQKFKSLYHIHELPCLCIIDPNTGRKEHDFIIPDSPTAVAKVRDDVIGFLDKHPNPKAKPKKVVPTAPSSKQTVMSTEDELLQAAIAASMQDAKEDEMNENSNGNKNNNNNTSNNDISMDDWNTGNDDNNNDFDNDNDNDNEMVSSHTQEKEKEKEIKKEKKIELDQEPAPGDKSGTALRIRMPNGQTWQRRFKKDSKIQQLYTYVSLTAQKDNFSLFTPMPRTVLDDHKDKTFAEMHLERATVVCSFDE